MITKNKRLIAILLTAMFLLLIRLIANQFTEGGGWSPFDFAVAAVLLFGAGLVCEFALRTVKKTRHRIAVCAAVLFALFLVWAELAVGIFGTPFAGS